MEAPDQNSFPQYVTVHRADDRHARIGGLLRRTLRDLEFHIERVQFERVVMVRTRRRAGAHVRVRSQADLTASVGQLTLRDTFLEAGRRRRDVPDQPVRHIHLRALVEHRLRVVKQKDKTLCAQRHL